MILISKKILLLCAVGDALFWFSLGALIFSGGCDGY